jgi:hypothetical protein
VVASAWISRTGLRVAAGQPLRITVPGEQVWWDASRPSHPLQGDPGSPTMNVLAGRKRVLGKNWFVLVAGVIGDGMSSNDPPDHPTALCVESLDHPNVDYSPSIAGELVFFANDAKAIWPAEKLFYDNNHGHAWVVVTALG